jgi:membrane-bound lytic murein transglycosylase B
MGKYFLAACLTATALVPVTAFAQQSCERQAGEAWLERYINAANSESKLNRAETNRAMRDLNSIRRSERYMSRNRDDELSVRDEAAINVRLDRLSGQLRITTIEDARSY